jgi:sigma-B regulation protein RsbU (phosphoserine phosphatase)
MPDGKIGLLIADVVDKGVGAALYMALSWSLIRTYAAEYPNQPERVLGAANQRILSDTSTEQFVSVFYGILDPGTGQLTYCNAGHLPPYLLAAENGRPAQPLSPTGMVLGVEQDESWGQASVELQPGDVLVLYTDGITDALDEGGAFFDEDRLLDAVRASWGRQAQEIKAAVLEAVRQFTGGAPQLDDIALMVLVRDTGP